MCVCRNENEYWSIEQPKYIALNLPAPLNLYVTGCCLGLLLQPTHCLPDGLLCPEMLPVDSPDKLSPLSDLRKTLKSKYHLEFEAGTSYKTSLALTAHVPCFKPYRRAVSDAEEKKVEAGECGWPSNPVRGLGGDRRWKEPQSLSFLLTEATTAVFPISFQVTTHSCWNAILWEWPQGFPSCHLSVCTSRSWNIGGIQSEGGNKLTGWDIYVPLVQFN